MDLLGDVRFSFRTLINHPGFSALAATILAIGIGVNAAVFTVTNAVLFKGFPHVDPNNRLLYIGSLKKGSGSGVSYPDFEDWRAQAKSFHGMAVVANGGLRFILGDPRGGVETCDGTELGANTFQVLGQKPILGRDFALSDEAPGAAPVAILNYDFWERRYGKDPSIIGKTIGLNGSPTTVVGIMAPGFDFPHHRVDLWLPLVPTPSLQKRETRVLWFVVGRMADGVTIRSARAEMDTIGRRLENAYPMTNRDVRLRVMNSRRLLLVQMLPRFMERSGELLVLCC
jgi:putative ABC transport system permease protein